MKPVPRSGPRAARATWAARRPARLRWRGDAAPRPRAAPRRCARACPSPRCPTRASAACGSSTPRRCQAATRRPPARSAPEPCCAPEWRRRRGPFNLRSRPAGVGQGTMLRVVETQLELRTVRCPRCAGELVIRVAAEEARARLAAAQTRIDTLLRRVDALEASLAGAHRNLERAEQRHRSGEQEAGLRTEISRLEGALAEARAEVRKAEEATRGNVSPGKRPIEME